MESIAQLTYQIIGLESKLKNPNLTNHKRMKIFFDLKNAKASLAEAKQLQQLKTRNYIKQLLN